MGESGVGKTGLAIRLAEDRWRETESTHGMNVWPLELLGVDAVGIEREIWLWDFAGQPDYLLVHQLYMDETALALMVIDPRRDDPFEPLGHWEQALKAAVKHDPARLLVAGRGDVGGLTISQAKVDAYVRAHGYDEFVATSAKTGEGCKTLKALIAAHIPWDRLPWTLTTELFKALKDAILRIKEQDIVLIRVAELRQRLNLVVKGRTMEEDELRTVIGLLAAQGVIQKLDFGDFVLLRPELINNYASAVVRSARDSADEIGCVAERDALEGEIDFKEMKRIPEADEKILLRAMVRTFIDRSLCVRVETNEGSQLVFPSYFKQERPENPDRPNVVVTYGFSGPLDEIYSTLVVRLRYTNDFEMDHLWRYAADFKTLTGKRVGLILKKKKASKAEIQVHFQARTAVDAQVSFIKFIHEHLKKRAQDITRVRSYVCPSCGVPVENRRAVRIRLEKGLDDVICIACEDRVPLRDLIETKFASDEFLRTVQEMGAKAQINLDNESLELILIGHAFSTTGEAGHIFRPTANSDWESMGKLSSRRNGKASGRRVYLQLKSGDSYLRSRKRDDKEIFQIKNPRHAKFWQSHEYPVMLVIRGSDGKIRWMNVSDYLKKHGSATKQIEFEGEPFTALNVANLANAIFTQGD